MTPQEIRSLFYRLRTAGYSHDVASAMANRGQSPELGQPVVHSPESTTPGPVEIPEDWRELPWGARRELALNFNPSAKTKDEVEMAIVAELERREAETDEE